MKKSLLFLAALVTTTLVPLSAQADEGWVVQSFNDNITVETSGTVTVKESIDVDFGGLAKHGIYRDIPYGYSNPDGTTTYTDIEVSSVTESGSSIPYTTSYISGNYLEIKIGDAKRTVTGKQHYLLTYVATGILRGFPQYDELYWNVTGNNWPVPIQAASATVHFPKDGATQVSCYTGGIGSTDSTCQKSFSGLEATSSTTAALAPSEGFTIAVGYTKGMVPLLVVTESPSSLAHWLKKISFPIVGFSFLVTLILLVSLIIRQYRKVGRDGSEAGARISRVVVPEYVAPGGMTPGEVGLLLDEKADTLDVSATIVDLAVRGFLTITEVPKKWMFGSVDYQLNRTKKTDAGLRRYETYLLGQLFSTGDEVLLSSLKNTFYTSLSEVKNQLYIELTERGLFATNPEKTRQLYLGIGFALLAAGMVLVFPGFTFPSSFLLGSGPAIAISGIVMIVMSRAMPRRTALGTEMYQKALGYKMFLSATEKYRQPFFENQNLFMEVLSYAIVFGVTEKLAKAFSQMGIQPPAPSWYYGTQPFNPAFFASSMGSFSNSISSAMASTPSSSGSGGGGFSGGGFGGGGGGSW